MKLITLENSSFEYRTKMVDFYVLLGTVGVISYMICWRLFIQYVHKKCIIRT